MHATIDTTTVQQIINAIEAERAKFEQQARDARVDSSYQWAAGMERGLKHALDIIAIVEQGK